MADMPVTRRVAKAGDWQGAWDLCTLDYEARFLRRRVLRTVHDAPFLVDLAHTESLDHGDAFMLEDGRLVEVIAAEEPLLAVSGADLPRLAWHIGNRHTPCQIEAERLLIRRDRVIADMLARLGAMVAEVHEPFTPEGGAYGHGRTHGHDHGHGHGPEAAAPRHGHGHGNGHGHGHDHGHGQDHGHEHENVHEHAHDNEDHNEDRRGIPHEP